MPSLPSHPALAPRHLPVPLKDLGMLMKEQPIKLVELVGFNRSNVLCGALRRESLWAVLVHIRSPPGISPACV
jgi:hypothetical protein